jgi:hypothetical protein
VSKYDKKIQDKWIRSLSEQEKERDIPLLFSIAFILLCGYLMVGFAAWFQGLESLQGF